ncbi:MAG: hypothetical protein CTY15_14200 [Methylocystis sp.]|nr:MAG: hypothetical protein CTY15_14200 [Methylocystis sp.]
MRARLFAILSTVILAGAAGAQEGPPTGGQAIGGLFDALGFLKPPPPAPDFVRESRPERLDYVPLAPRPETSRRRPAAEAQTVGAELDRAIAENRRKAARVKTPN